MPNTRKRTNVPKKLPILLSFLKLCQQNSKGSRVIRNFFENSSFLGKQGFSNESTTWADRATLISPLLFIALDILHCFLLQFNYAHSVFLYCHKTFLLVEAEILLNEDSLLVWHYCSPIIVFTILPLELSIFFWATKHFCLYKRA